MKYTLTVAIMLVFTTVGMVGMYKAGYHDAKIVRKIIYTYKESDIVYSMIKDHEQGKIKMNAESFKLENAKYCHDMNDSLVGNITILALVDDDDRSLIESLRKIK